MKSEVGSEKSEGADLKARTFEFGVRCVKLADALPQTRSGSAIANQVVRCGTSVGANYRAALRARSRNEFIAKPGVVEEECDETLYWIAIIKELGMVEERLLTDINREADELLAITISSIKTARSNAKTPFKK